LWCCIKALLHSLEQMLKLPSQSAANDLSEQF
jgi:hypothetical protein